MSELLCSESSFRADEPIAGSAVRRTWRWLALEYRPRWESRAVKEAQFPIEVRAWLDRFLALPGTRVQLIRRTRRKGPLAVQFADTTPNEGWVRSGSLSRYEDLLDFEPEALLSDQAPLQPHQGPLLWVCTHGQRDFCCAKHGGRLYTALRAELGDAVWQTSHLGGHRFAATLLVLPSGLSYGRLTAFDAPALAEAIRADRLYRLDRLRGRVAWSAEAQAAEIALRRIHDDLNPLAPTVLSESPEAVQLQVHDQVHTVAIERRPVAEPIISSCGKPAALRDALWARPP